MPTPSRPDTGTPARPHDTGEALTEPRPGLVVSLDPYLPLKDLAAYSGLGVRTLRGHLHRRSNGLPFYQLEGKILVRRSEFDRWMRQFRRAPDASASARQVDLIVDEVLRSLTTPADLADNPARVSRGA